MTPPHIRIKKGSIVYDDSGAQQETRPFRPDLRVTPSRRRFGRRKVGPRASLFPLLIIAAGLFIFFRLVPHALAARSTVAGWQVTLHVTPYLDTLVVGVTFVSRAGKPAADAPEASVRVTLPGTDQEVVVSGALERSPMTLSGRLPATTGATRVQADVVIQGSRVRLTAKAPPPAPSTAQPPAQSPAQLPAPSH